MAQVQQPTNAWSFHNVSDDSGRDPTELPSNVAEHETRIAKSLWGPRWARLRPASIVTLKPPRTCVMKDYLTGKQYDVDKHWIVEWREGLFILDSLARSGESITWLDESLLNILRKERTKFKDNLLRPSLYVEQKGLLSIAVSGKPLYRRKGLKETDDQDGEALAPYYQIQHVKEYMPPWEGFLHPKCGLYQDWYLVQWAAPYDKVDYSAEENGGDAPGTTWEPDEVLPEALDKFRLALKKSWTEKAKAKEISLPAADLGPKPKKAKYNPLNVQMFEDIMNPKKGHGWAKAPGDFDESLIRQGWPKSEKDYPPGHRAATPPGFCTAKCDCMEDWHIGSKSMSKDWLQDRQQGATLGVQLFSQMEIVRRRGTVSGQHYLEPVADNPRVDTDDDKILFDLTKSMWQSVGEAAQSIPLDALKGNDLDSKSILSHYAYVFSTCSGGTGNVPLYVPMQFRPKTAPPWLQVEPDTGHIRLVTNMLPGQTGGSTIVPVQIELLDCNLKPTPLSFKIHTDKPAFLSERVRTLTTGFVTKIERLKDVALQSALKELFKEVYDFDKRAVLVGKRVGCWARVIVSVVTTTRGAYRASQFR